MSEYKLGDIVMFTTDDNKGLLVEIFEINLKHSMYKIRTLDNYNWRLIYGSFNILTIHFDDLHDETTLYESIEERQANGPMLHVAC